MLEQRNDDILTKFRLLADSAFRQDRQWRSSAQAVQFFWLIVVCLLTVSDNNTNKSSFSRRTEQSQTVEDRRSTIRQDVRQSERRSTKTESDRQCCRSTTKTREVPSSRKSDRRRCRSQGNRRSTRRALQDPDRRRGFASEANSSRHRDPSGS